MLGYVLQGLKARFPSSTLLPVFLGVPLLKPNSRKKGTLIIKGLLGNLERVLIRVFYMRGFHTGLGEVRHCLQYCAAYT